MPFRQLELQTSTAPAAPESSPLADALHSLRTELGLDRSFTRDELEEAEDARRRGPLPLEGRPRRDARDLPLCTLDPAGSRDLDQALSIERKGSVLEIHYAIADVAAFVRPGGALDRGARERGLTLYCPDRRLPLYPASLSEDAASLAPGRDRPALLWTFQIETAEAGATAGVCRAARIERAWVRSRRAWSYAEADRHIAGAADDGSHPFALLAAVGDARRRAELRRGGVSLPIPSQTARLREGRVELAYERNRPIEGWNAQVSLLTGMQAARAMLGVGRGLLRTLPPADTETMDELRLCARALGIEWPAERSYPDFVRTLDPEEPEHAAMIAQCTTALRGAGYLALGPEAARDAHLQHAALASAYAHVTAPLRRLADRYANEVALAAFEGREPPAWALEAVEDMPRAMGAAGRRSSELSRASIDLVEAAVLAPQVGDHFEALVVRSRPRRSQVQLRSPAVRAPVDRELPLGDELAVRLVEASLEERRVRFEAVASRAGDPE